MVNRLFAYSVTQLEPRVKDDFGAVLPRVKLHTIETGITTFMNIGFSSSVPRGMCAY